MIGSDNTWRPHGGFLWVLTAIGVWLAVVVVVTFYYMLNPVEMTGVGKLGNPRLMLVPHVLFVSILASLLCLLAYRRKARLAASAFALAAILSVIMGLWTTFAVWRRATQYDVPVSWSFFLLPHINGGVPNLDKTVTYGTAPGGSQLLLDVWPARGIAESQLRPAMVMVHGGSWVAGFRSGAGDWNEWFNQLGYDVFDIEYRMPPLARWRDEVGDVKCALGWVVTNAAKYHVDTGRISLMGRSAGANLALLAAYSMGDPELPPSCQAADVKVRSVINVYGPTDLALLYRTSGSQAYLLDAMVSYIGGTPSEFADRYKVLSPTSHISREAPPTITLHGEADRIVPVEQAVVLDMALNAARVYHETYYLPWVDHAFDNMWGNIPTQIARAKIKLFLAQHAS